MTDNEKQDAQGFGSMAKQYRNELEKKMAATEEMDYYGVVDANGAESVGYDKERWDLIVTFNGWRQGDSDVILEKQPIKLKSSRLEVKRIQTTITPYDILHIRARLIDHGGKRQLITNKIISTDYHDNELNAHAEMLRKPVIFKDPTLGELVLDRKIDNYRGRPKWRGQEIELKLLVRESDNIEPSLTNARTLWDKSRKWDTDIKNYAVEHLLPLKNEDWLEEGDKKVSPGKFKKLMKLFLIEIDYDGRFFFWYNDGGLFYGHLILITGDLSKGLTDIDLQG